MFILMPRVHTIHTYVHELLGKGSLDSNTHIRNCKEQPQNHYLWDHVNVLNGHWYAFLCWPCPSSSDVLNCTILDGVWKTWVELAETMKETSVFQITLLGSLSLIFTYSRLYCGMHTAGTLAKIFRGRIFVILHSNKHFMVLIWQFACW